MLFILENYTDASFQDAIAREQEQRCDLLGSYVPRELLQGEVRRQASGCMYFVLMVPNTAILTFWKAPPWTVDRVLTECHSAGSDGAWALAGIVCPP